MTLLPRYHSRTPTLLVGNGEEETLNPADYELVCRCNHGVAKGCHIWFNSLINGDDERYGDELYGYMVRTNGKDIRRHAPTTNGVWYIRQGEWDELNHPYLPKKLTTGSMAVWWLVTVLGIAPDCIDLTGFTLENLFDAHDGKYDREFIQTLLGRDIL